MAMRSNSVRSIMTENQEAFRGMVASAIRVKLNSEYGFNLGSDGQIPSIIKELYGNGSTVKTSDSVKVHFNGYSNNLSTEFRRAYGSYCETDSSAPKLADIFSQVTQDAKDFIASIAENPLFKAFLNASNCREPSKDFALIGVKTSAMLQAEKEASEKLASDLARKIEELEKNGFLVLNTALENQVFNFAEEAIAASSQIDLDYKVYSANIAELAKIKKGLESLEKNLAKSSTETAKETLTATISDQKIDLAKLEEKVTLQGQNLIGLSNRSKRFAELSTIRHVQLCKVVAGLVDASEYKSKLASESAIEAEKAVADLIKAIEKSAPEVIDPRASKLAEKRGISIQDALQIIKDME